MQAGELPLTGSWLMPLADLFPALTGLFTSSLRLAKCGRTQKAPSPGPHPELRPKRAWFALPSQKQLPNGLPPGNLCTNHLGKNLSTGIAIQNHLWGNFCEDNRSENATPCCMRCVSCGWALCVSCVLELAKLRPQGDHRDLPNLNWGTLIPA